MKTENLKLAETEGRERVETLVTEFAEVWRKRIETDHRKKVFNAVREFRITGDILVVPATKDSYGREYNRRNYFVGLLGGLLERVDTGRFGYRVGEPSCYVLVPDWRAKVKAKMAREGDEAVARFIFKVTEKLLNIVDRIPGNFTVSTHGELWRSTLLFKWENGVEFRVENKIVYAVRESRNGWTPYNSYPLTFHNVILEDGSKMKTPSEAKLKKHFGNIDTAPKELTLEDKKRKRKPDNIRHGKSAKTGKPVVFADCPVCGKTVSASKNYSGYHFFCHEKHGGCGWSGYSRNSY